MTTRRALGVALLVGGLLLLFFGWNASEGIASDVSEALTGTPTERSMWMLVLGAAATVFGGILAVMPTRANHRHHH